MINIENQVFSLIATSIRVDYPGIFVKSEYVKVPAKFPCVTIVEMDNTTSVRYQSSALMETHADITYEINIYSNKSSGKKTECRTIANSIDTYFQKIGFTRTMMNPVQNLEDSTVYRIISRYRAVVSNNNIIYRRA